MKNSIRNLIWLVASALLFFGVLQIGLEFLKREVRQREISLVNCAVGGALVLGGIALFAGSKRLAEHFGDDDDDDDNPPIQIPPPGT